MRLIVAVAILILLAPFGAMAADNAVLEVRTGSDKEAKVAIAEFRKVRPVSLEAVQKLATCVHEDVVAEFLKVLVARPKGNGLEDLALKEDILAILKGLKPPLLSQVCEGLAKVLATQRASAEVLALVVRTVGELDYRQAWREIVALLRYGEGEVVLVAALTLLGEWKELRAHKELQAFWDKHSSVAGGFRKPKPNGGPQSAQTKKDQADFERKHWNAVNPETLTLLRATAEEITGRDNLSDAQKFRDWCKSDEGKRRISEAMRQRDE